MSKYLFFARFSSDIHASMLDIFVAPSTINCLLCQGVVSVRRGAKERFKNHLSQDHEVHFDMDLLFAMSRLGDGVKKDIISYIESFEEGLKVSQDDINESLSDQVEILEVPDTPAKEEKSKSEELKIGSATTVGNIKEELKAFINSEKANENLKERVQEFGYVSSKKTTSQESVDVDSTKFSENRTFVKSPTFEKSKSNRTGENEEPIVVNIKTESDTSEDNDVKKETSINNFTDNKICDKPIQKKLPKIDLKKYHSDLQKYHNKKSGNQKKFEPPLYSKFKNVLPNQKVQKCKICSKDIIMENYGKHLKRNHMGSTHKCDLCYTKFKRKDHLNLHINSVHKNEKHLLSTAKNGNEAKFSCDLCTLTFVTQSLLNFHIKKKHGKGTKQCHLCKRYFGNSSNLKLHVIKCRGEITKICE